ncbi:hypothetical protein BH24CHL1_BH24CHL1_00490 [soil metagenome]
MQLQDRISLQFIPSIDESFDIDDSSVAFGWWLERLLARVRWFAVPVCVLTVFLFPSVSAWLLLLPAFTYGLGNIPVSWVLSRPCTRARLRPVRAAATGLDWLGAFASIYAFSGEPAAATPTVLLLLVVTTALRFQLAGLVFASLAALVALVTLVTMQLFVLDVIQPAQEVMVVGSWVVVLGVMALVLGVLFTGFERWQLQEQGVKGHLRDTLKRMQTGLTEREWQVLRTLPRQDFTYEAIGHELFISSRTVKAHVRHIGEKLGVRGRRAVVTEATRRGLLLPQESADDPEYPPSGGA